MTQKKFQVKQRENSEWVVKTTWSDRSSAVQAVATSLINDDTLTPQDLDIVEIDVVEEEAVVMAAAEKIAKSLELYAYKFEVKSFFSGGEGFADLAQKDKVYPSLSCIALKHIAKAVDEVNAELPEGYEMLFSITHTCAIRIILTTPEDTK